MADNFLSWATSQQSAGAMGKSQYVVARVTSVVYGPYLADGRTANPDYNDITSIGEIRYVPINTSQYHSLIGISNKPAKPFFSFIHQYPLQDEYVYIIPGPGLGLNENAGDLDYYYIGPIKLWGSCHHNAFPDLTSYTQFLSITNPTYQDAEQGVTPRAVSQPMEYPLGDDFVEKSNLKNLIPFTGDTLIEGRHGQSIRFGSTNPSYKQYNTWSDTGSAGDPIIIIRNGQGNQSNKLGYVPAVENLNVDQSSIYLTAGQQINIDDLAQFPLTSWNVDIQQSSRTVITLTQPPTANETLSPAQQDVNTLYDSQQQAFFAGAAPAGGFPDVAAANLTIPSEIPPQLEIPDE